MAPDKPAIQEKATIAAFDFDGTITTRDTFIRFLAWRRSKIRLVVDLCLTVHLLILYAVRLTGNETHKMALFGRRFAGVPTTVYQDQAHEFAREIIPGLINPVALQRIKFHQAQGHEVVIITASLVDWVLPWATTQGIKSVLGSVAECENDVVTGRLKGENCHGPEKLRRLLEIHPKRSSYNLIAYGDSRGDRELLTEADTGYFQRFE